MELKKYLRNHSQLFVVLHLIFFTSCKEEVIEKDSFEMEDVEVYGIEGVDLTPRVVDKLNMAIQEGDTLTYNYRINELKWGQSQREALQYIYMMLLENNYNKCYYDLVDLNYLRFNEGLSEDMKNHFMFLLSMAKLKGYKWKSIGVGEKKVYYDSILLPCNYIK